MGFETSIIFLMAIGTSLASIFFSAISSALSHHKKRSVEWPLVVPLSVGMILGAVIGAKYAATLTNENLKWIITIFLIVIGIEIIFNFTKSLAKKDKKLIDQSGKVRGGLRMGGRVEYKSGNRVCKIAKRGFGRAYGKNS